VVPDLEVPSREGLHILEPTTAIKIPELLLYSNTYITKGSREYAHHY